MKTILFRIWQWTWGFPQTMIGFIIFLFNQKEKHFSFHRAIAIYWNKPIGFSYGMFIFIPPKPRFYNNDHYNYSADELRQRLTVHEYGHSIQSMVLGPLMLLVVGVPSSIWSFSKYGRKIRESGKSYFDFYTEKSANALGERFSGKKSMERIDV